MSDHYAPKASDGPASTAIACDLTVEAEETCPRSTCKQVLEEPSSVQVARTIVFILGLRCLRLRCLRCSHFGGDLRSLRGHGRRLCVVVGHRSPAAKVLTRLLKGCSFRTEMTVSSTHRSSRALIVRHQICCSFRTEMTVYSTHRSSRALIVVACMWLLVCLICHLLKWSLSKR